MITTA